MLILKKVQEVEAFINNEELVIIQRNEMDEDDIIAIPSGSIEAFILGLQQVIEDHENGQ